MVWLDGDKFLACGKVTKINQDKNRWITVTIFSGKKKNKNFFQKEVRKKVFRKQSFEWVHRHYCWRRVQ